MGPLAITELQNDNDKVQKLLEYKNDNVHFMVAQVPFCEKKILKILLLLFDVEATIAVFICTHG